MHVTQLVDIRFFGPLKHAWKRAMSHWASENPGDQITKNNFPGIFKMAWDEITVGDKARNANKKAGIFPFDVDNVDVTRLVVNDQKSAAAKVRAMVQKMAEEYGLVVIAEQNDNDNQEQQ